MTFSELVDQHIGLSFRKQLALADLLGKHSWQLDLGKGTVDFGKGPGLFGKRRIYPIQVIGTEAEDSGTWLWAWANAESHIPPGVLKAVERVRAFGESQGIEPLSTGELPSEAYPGHLLASVACGIAQADAYYRGPYPGGAVFFLIHDTPLSEAPPTPGERILTVLTQVIGTFEVNHRAMARAYLEAEGFRLDEGERALTATDRSGHSLKMTLDDRGRMENLATTIRGPR